VSKKSIDAFHRAHPRCIVADIRRTFRSPQELKWGIMHWDPFQSLGIPCWKTPMLLDNPSEPAYPFAENH
jgi:hypothetical protein